MSMTWREIAEAIEAMPEDRKDDWALVWIPHDVPYESYDEFQDVIALSPYDAESPLSDDNPFSLSLGVW